MPESLLNLSILSLNSFSKYARNQLRTTPTTRGLVDKTSINL